MDNNFKAFLMLIFAFAIGIGGATVVSYLVR